MSDDIEISGGVAESPEAAAGKVVLSPHQQAGLDAIVDFLRPADPRRFFVLRGYAGVGKTTLLTKLLPSVRGKYVLTAPTNKAVRVMKDMLSSETQRPICRTIYSLLGLRLEPNGELKELTQPEDPVDLTEYRLIVIDEASMLNSELLSYLDRLTTDLQIKVLFIGDPAQLPPVGETLSPVWKLLDFVELTEVRRNGGAILEFCTELRNKLSHPAPSVSPQTSFEGDRGMWRLAANVFQSRIASAADRRLFLQPDFRCVAWRNTTVDALNRTVRRHMFGPDVPFWVQEDRVIMTQPAKDLEGYPMLATDDEGTISRIVRIQHPLYPEWEVDSLTVQFDHGKIAQVLVLAPEQQASFDRHLRGLADEAKVVKRLWKTYWDMKEAFHSVRHAYAITAHRSQGSTYRIAFVDAWDILQNRTRREAIQCLYVACSRPTQQLHLHL